MKTLLALLGCISISLISTSSKAGEFDIQGSCLLKYVDAHRGFTTKEFYRSLPVQISYDLKNASYVASLEDPLLSIQVVIHRKDLEWNTVEKTISRGEAEVIEQNRFTPERTHSVWNGIIKQKNGSYLIETSFDMRLRKRIDTGRQGDQYKLVQSPFNTVELECIFWVVANPL